MNLADILKDSNYKLSQFSPLEIDSIERSLIIKQTKSGDAPYVNCLVRQNKEIKLSPESRNTTTLFAGINQAVSLPNQR